MSLLCKNLYQIAPFVIMVIGAHTPPQQSGAQRYDLLWFGSSRYHPRVSSSEGGGCGGDEGEEYGPPPQLPLFPPPHRRKQGCYNLLSWLSMKVRGRATRASVRLDLLPLTPTVYLLSAISLSLSACLSLSTSCSSSVASLAHPGCPPHPPWHSIIHALSVLIVCHLSLLQSLPDRQYVPARLFCAPVFNHF